MQKTYTKARKQTKPKHKKINKKEKEGNPDSAKNNCF